MTVLVVEDDPDQLMTRAMLLRESGFTVVEAGSYSAALKAVRGTAVSCAVLDLRLPTEEEGLALIRDLKIGKPAIPIYVLTGSRVGLGACPPELALADGIFPKGSSIAALLEKLRSLPADSQDV